MVNNVYKEGPLSKHILPTPSACPNICASCKSYLPERYNSFEDHFYECILTEAMKVYFIISIVGYETFALTLFFAQVNLSLPS